ncbi:MAG: hypothetical protein IH621_18075 [Krumholzibacteria bacterium]|nr:hypothetical protein [Candidatus Krumholzibacteria bacterium]
MPTARASGYDDLGGDDATVVNLDRAYTPGIAIAGNGDIYVAVESHPLDGREIRIYRSRDGGETWEIRGEFAAEAEGFKDPSLVIAEGAAERIFLAYTHFTAEDRFRVEVAYADLASPGGEWTRVPVETDADVQSYRPCLASDHLNHDSYNLYLVYAGDQAGYADIWFARSTDQGAGWQAPYIIAENATTDSDFARPAVCCGFGGYVHTTWQVYSRYGSFDDAVVYRRAAGRADAGAGAWGSALPLTATTDGYWDGSPHVAAAAASPDVMIVHHRYAPGETGWLEMRPAGVFMSHDQGATFASQGEVPGGLSFYHGLLHQETTGQWIIDGMLDDGWAIQRGSGVGPLSWSPPELFSDDDAGEARPFDGRIAVDPTRSDRVAAVWILWEGLDEWVEFDAEWRRDPGYPNLEPGFPRDHDHMPISPAGLVDLDGDGDLEIVYGSNDRRIHAWHHDGSPLAGWPVDVGLFLTDGPVAVGDLRGDGTLYVVAGTMDGLAVAYLADGQPAPGWPFDAGTGEPAYVSIGALGGEDARSVVVASGTRTTFASWQGLLPAGAFVRNHYFRTHIAPCAAGDIDGDGTAEVVCGPGDQILAFRMCTAMTVLGRYLPTPISDAVTLADLDLDGDVEILAPTSDGTLFAVHGNGSDVAGAWPFVSGTGSPLTSAAVARMVGPEAPGLAVGSRERAIHLLDEDGVQRAGFPVFTGEPWDLLAAPIIGPVAGDVPDVVVADRANLAWSWSDVGAVNPGFPRDIGEMVIDSPALGDLDLDGSVELVVLTGNQMRIFDLGRSALPAAAVWPMYGHDAQRTGCADHPVNPPSPVTDDEVKATRLSFASPHPNPFNGQASFHFALPARAAVSLDIVDLRGRRVATVVNEEREAGSHVVQWNGRDRQGRTVAAGHYVARLRISGDGRQQTLTRKVTVLH